MILQSVRMMYTEVTVEDSTAAFMLELGIMYSHGLYSCLAIPAAPDDSFAGIVTVTMPSPLTIALIKFEHVEVVSIQLTGF